MRFLILYSGNLNRSQDERSEARFEDINTIEELLALHDAEMAKQPEDVRGLVLLRSNHVSPVSFLKAFPREEWPEWEVEVYDYYRE